MQAVVAANLKPFVTALVSLDGKLILTIIGRLFFG
jgi:hypothetical protein